MSHFTKTMDSRTKKEVIKIFKQYIIFKILTIAYKCQENSDLVESYDEKWSLSFIAYFERNITYSIYQP